MAGGGENGFSCPDNLAFDLSGNLWMTTDMSGSVMNKEEWPYMAFKNNSLFVIPRIGKDAGKVIRVANAPRDAEFTGPWFSPDGKTLFLSVQHPGEQTIDLKNPTSLWPFDKDNIRVHAYLNLSPDNTPENKVWRLSEDETQKMREMERKVYDDACVEEPVTTEPSAINLKEVVKRLTSELVEQNKAVAQMETKRNSLRQRVVGLRKKLKRAQDDFSKSEARLKDCEDSLKQSMKRRKTLDEKMGYVKQFDDIQKRMSDLEKEKATLFSQISIDF